MEKGKSGNMWSLFRKRGLQKYATKALFERTQKISEGTMLRKIQGATMLLKNLYIILAR